jgi:hypothetical protein
LEKSDPRFDSYQPAGPSSRAAATSRDIPQDRNIPDWLVSKIVNLTSKIPDSLFVNIPSLLRNLKAAIPKNRQWSPAITPIR